MQENVPMNLTARIKGELGNDFISEDEKVSPAQITKDLEITNQDDNIISEDETKMDLPAKILEDLENTNQDVKSDDETKKDLPSWLRGDLANMDQDDYFVTEDESERRILLILKILSTLLLIVCSILAVKCFEYSSFSVKRRIIYSSNGKYSRTKSHNIMKIKIYLSFIYQFFRYILFWTYSASFGFSDGKWFSVEYKVK